MTICDEKAMGQKEKRLPLMAGCDTIPTQMMRRVLRFRRNKLCSPPVMPLPYPWPCVEWIAMVGQVLLTC